MRCACPGGGGAAPHGADFSGDGDAFLRGGGCAYAADCAHGGCANAADGSGGAIVVATVVATGASTRIRGGTSALLGGSAAP